MHPDLLHVGELTLHSYSVVLLAAFVVAGLVRRAETRRLGYDRRAIWIQSLIAACVLPICYFAFDPTLDTNDPVMPLVQGLAFDRDFNINWVHAFYDRPEPAVGSLRLWQLLLGYPILIHLPTHLLLSLRRDTRPRA